LQWSAEKKYQRHQNTMTFGVRQKTSGYDKTMVC
jgi:hypothetical protein